MKVARGVTFLKPYSFERRLRASDALKLGAHKFILTKTPEAFERVLKSDVRYRFGMDMGKL